jgi:hypothetical protein
MHQDLQGATFHVKHIRLSARGGSSEPDNLALACPGCNLRKSDRVDATDPESGAVVALFNPRTDSFAHHFRWNGLRILARSATGRATITTLGLNDHRRILIRQAEALFGLFPPNDLDR